MAKPAWPISTKSAGRSPASDPNGHDRVAGYRDHETAPEADFRPLRVTLEHIKEALPEATTPGQPG
ncbi:MAG: hypothetical protein ACLP8X_19360 [Streptosporangiaceae bacterium]